MSNSHRGPSEGNLISVCNQPVTFAFDDLFNIEYRLQLLIDKKRC